MLTLMIAGKEGRCSGHWCYTIRLGARTCDTNTSNTDHTHPYEDFHGAKWSSSTNEWPSTRSTKYRHGWTSTRTHAELWH